MLPKPFKRKRVSITVAKKLELIRKLEKGAADVSVGLGLGLVNIVNLSKTTAPPLLPFLFHAPRYLSL